MSTKPWDRHASNLLDEAKVRRVPVDIIGVARHLEISVITYDLGNDVSGLLIQKGDNVAIGVNSNHSMVRQRFTIAHEIGHFLFHRNNSSLFVDDNQFVAFRNDRSSKGIDVKEREANAFAASILMPRSEIIDYANRLGFDFSDDSSLKRMANTFEVSQQAMSYRLSHLLGSIPKYPSR